MRKDGRGKARLRSTWTVVVGNTVGAMCAHLWCNVHTPVGVMCVHLVVEEVF
jgi:hypothetical protein